MYLRVWQIGPVYCAEHWHVLGWTQVPPFWQLGPHIAVLRKNSIISGIIIMTLYSQVLPQTVKELTFTSSTSSCSVPRTALELRKVGSDIVCVGLLPLCWPIEVAHLICCHWYNSKLINLYTLIIYTCPIQRVHTWYSSTGCSRQYVFLSEHERSLPGCSKCCMNQRVLAI